MLIRYKGEICNSDNVTIMKKSTYYDEYSIWFGPTADQSFRFKKKIDRDDALEKIWNGLITGLQFLDLDNEEIYTEKIN